MAAGATTIARWAPLAGVLVLAAAARLVAIESQGLWTDEALTITVARQGYRALFLTSTDQTPGLYYALHKLVVGEGAGLAAMRSISVAAGLVAVGLMYAVGRVAIGRLGGFVCALLLAVAGPHVDYSQEARAYALLFAATLTATLGVLLYGRKDRALHAPGLLLLAVGDLAAFYAHLTAVFWIVPTVAIAAWVAGRRREWRGLLLCLAAMALGAAPGLYRLVTVDTVSGFNWLAQANPARFATTLSSVFLPAGLWPRGGGTAAVGVAACLLALVVGLYAARRGFARRLRREPVFAAVLAAYLAVPFAIWAFGLIGPPIFLGRTVLFALAGFVLLLGAVIASLPRARLLAAAVVAAVYAAGALSNGLQAPQEDWRGATAFVQAAAAPGDLLVVCPRWEYPAVRYHARGPSPVPVLVADDKGLALLEPRLGAQPAWADVFNWSYSRWDAAPKRTLAIAPGASIWTLEFNCPPGLLAALPPSRQVAWREKRRNGAVVATRRVARAPLSLTVPDIAEDFARRPGAGNGGRGRD